MHQLSWLDPRATPHGPRCIIYRVEHLYMDYPLRGGFVTDPVGLGNILALGLVPSFLPASVLTTGGGTGIFIIAITALLQSAINNHLSDSAVTQHRSKDVTRLEPLVICGALR